jgi:serine/threonine protein kinase
MKTRRNRRRTHKRGGKTIGEGNSAKAIDPPIQCKDGRNMSGYVTRIVKNGDKKELLTISNPEVIERLKRIDPYQKYFYYPQYCEPGELSEENIADGVTEENKAASEYVTKGYSSFGALAMKRRNWMQYFLGRKEWINQNKKFQGAIDHIIEGVKLLHKNKIAHNDLHSGNIIIGKDDLPRIIDFGEATLNSSKKVLDIEMSGITEFYNSYVPTSFR